MVGPEHAAGHDARRAVAAAAAAAREALEERADARRAAADLDAPAPRAVGLGDEHEGLGDLHREERPVERRHREAARRRADEHAPRRRRRGAAREAVGDEGRLALDDDLAQGLVVKVGVAGAQAHGRVELAQRHGRGARAQFVHAPRELRGLGRVAGARGRGRRGADARSRRLGPVGRRLGPVIDRIHSSRNSWQIW